MNFPNINKNWQLFSHSTGPLIQNFQGNDSSLTFATPQLQQIPSSQPMFKSGVYPGQTHEPTQFPPPSPSRQMSSNINMMSKKIALSFVYKKPEFWQFFHFFDPKFFSKIILLGLILCEERLIRAFLKLENASLTLIQCFVLKRKSKIFDFLPQNHSSGCNFMLGIDCAHSRSLKILS
jgi:hypothetical protein